MKPIAIKPRSALLRPGKEVQYVDSVTRTVYRSRPFWVDRDGMTALAIPDYFRSLQGRTWQPFDHLDPERYRTLFNFGPVAPEQVTTLVLPEAPPFFLHTLSGAALTRVKFGNGYSYGESASYRYGYGPLRRHPCWTLSKRPDITEKLPPRFQDLWLKALPYCETYD